MSLRKGNSATAKTTIGNRPYVGRFAPSPTGALHLGSLTTAIASYLHARQAGGEWLVRMEDIDPPREVPGAADSILHVLESLGLEWDRSVLYQRTRRDEYAAAAQALLETGAAFRCSCSRKDIRAVAKVPGPYPGTCRRGPTRPGPTAIRVRADDRPVSIEDHLQGSARRCIAETEGDYVVFRRDGLPAYHLAVVLDDAYQGVTDIVRGVDLLDSAFVHVHLQRLLGLPSPDYWHLPVVTNASGQKLSKQTGAMGIAPGNAGGAALAALALLGLQPPLDVRGSDFRELWMWAAKHWDIGSMAGRRIFDGS